MSVTNYNINNNRKKSPKLQPVIVEPILLYCINATSIYELSLEIQRILPLSYSALKKYLFYLINYELISYDGQKHLLL